MNRERRENLLNDINLFDCDDVITNAVICSVIMDDVRFIGLEVEGISGFIHNPTKIGTFEGKEVFVDSNQSINNMTVYNENMDIITSISDIDFMDMI